MGADRCRSAVHSFQEVAYECPHLPVSVVPAPTRYRAESAAAASAFSVLLHCLYPSALELQPHPPQRAPPPRTRQRLVPWSAVVDSSDNRVIGPPCEAADGWAEQAGMCERRASRHGTGRGTGLPQQWSASDWAPFHTRCPQQSLTTLRSFLISTHYTRYNYTLFALNFSALVFVLFPKLPIVSRHTTHVFQTQVTLGRGQARASVPNCFSSSGGAWQWHSRSTPSTGGVTHTSFAGRRKPCSERSCHEHGKRRRKDVVIRSSPSPMSTVSTCPFPTPPHSLPVHLAGTDVLSSSTACASTSDSGPTATVSTPQRPRDHLRLRPGAKRSE